MAGKRRDGSLRQTTQARGAINYFADIECLDLWGLGDSEVAKAKPGEQFNLEKITELTRARQMKIAVIYDGWFEASGGLPASWTKVGEWTTADCIVCGNPTVSFHAIDPAETSSLIRNLQSFSARLPARVAQAGKYTEQSRQAVNETRINQR